MTVLYIFNLNFIISSNFSSVIISKILTLISTLVTWFHKATEELFIQSQVNNWDLYHDQVKNSCWNCKPSQVAMALDITVSVRQTCHQFSETVYSGVLLSILIPMEKYNHYYQLRISYHSRQGLLQKFTLLKLQRSIDSDMSTSNCSIKNVKYPAKTLEIPQKDSRMIYKIQRKSISVVRNILST